MGRHLRAACIITITILSFLASPRAGTATPSGATGIPPATSFTIQNVDNTPAAGRRSSIEIDAAGAPHIEGRTDVSVVIEGSLRSGERVSAPLELTVLLPTGLAARIYPNPLNPAGRLSFTVRHPGSLRVRLFDVAGRLVRMLADERHAEAGPRELAFDGMDGRGVPLATGVYFYRIEAAGDVLTGRIAIAK